MKRPKIIMNINPFMPNELFYLHSSDLFISNIRGVWLIFINTVFYRNSCFLCKRSAASDLGLHCQCPFYEALSIDGLN